MDFNGTAGRELPTGPLVRSLVKIATDQYTFMAAGPSYPVNIPLQSYLIAHCQTGHKLGCAIAGFPPFFLRSRVSIITSACFVYLHIKCTADLSYNFSAFDVRTLVNLMKRRYLGLSLSSEQKHCPAKPKGSICLLVK